MAIEKKLSLAVLAEQSGINEELLFAEASSGKLKHYEIGGQFFTTEAFFNEFLENKLVRGIDNEAKPELSLQPTEEKIERRAKTMGKASVFHVSSKRNKQWLVQRDMGLADDGKRIRESKYFESKEIAENYADKLNEERQEMILRFGSDEISCISSPKATTPAVKFIEWYINSDEKKCSSRTKKGYLDALKIFSGGLKSLNIANVRLCELNSKVCNTVLERIAESKAQATVNKVRIVLCQSLKYAFEEDLLSGADFTAKIKHHKSEKETSKREPYTEGERELLKQGSAFDPLLHAAIVLFDQTGMRPEELRVLEWRNVDLARKTIRITNASVKVYEDLSLSGGRKYTEVLGKTKSKKGVRTLPIYDDAVTAITELRESIEGEHFRKNSKFVFSGISGDFITELELTSHWRMLIRRLDLKGKGYCFYRYRHTFCTDLALSNISQDKAAVLMGDSSIDMVNRIYSHIKSTDVIDETRAMFENRHIIQPTSA